MDDLRRRTLRLWAAIDAAYALVVAALALWAVPWKTPAANLVALAYAATIAAGVPALARQRRWAWRMAVVTSVVGLVAGALVVTGLVASWAYLRAVYGAFGAGASVVALMLAAIAFQALGLYPAIRLRALLRREVRMGAARGVGLLIGVVVVLPAPVAAGVHARFALSEIAPASDQSIADALTLARAVAEGSAGEAATLGGVPAGPGPVYVTLWRDGVMRARGAGSGSDLGNAVRAAAMALAAALPSGEPRPLAGTLRVERTIAVGPAPAWLPALAVGFSPGRDGLRARSGAVVLPDEPVRSGRVGAAPLLPALQELRVGVDPTWLATRLPDRDGLERFRTEVWIETPEGPARLDRGRIVAAPTDPKRAADAAVAYLARAVGPDGRFAYRYDPTTDAAPRDATPYSLARHAGCVWALTTLAPPSDASERAVAWLVAQVRMPCRGPGTACLIDNGEARVGPTALAAIALLEHAHATGDARHAPLARGLIEFLLSMQRSDGELDHVYIPSGDRVDARARLMFASEEAAFAFVVAHERLGDERHLRAAARALDYLTGPKYGFFLGRFVWGADAWTCIAADRAWPRLRERRYLDFCVGYAEFLRRLQYGGLARDQADYAGHYGFGGFMIPQAPAAAGFTEAVLATAALAQHHGANARLIGELRAQGRDALAALARDQLRPGDPRARNPARAEGGFARSLVEPEIRVDFVQHAALALARGAALGLR